MFVFLCCGAVGALPGVVVAPVLPHDSCVLWCARGGGGRGGGGCRQPISVGSKYTHNPPTPQVQFENTLLLMANESYSRCIQSKIHSEYKRYNFLLLWLIILALFIYYIPSTNTAPVLGGNSPCT